MNEYEDYGSEDPYAIFVFAMNAPQTKEKYTTRIDRFFRFINVQGDTIQERCKAFYEAAKKDNVWALKAVPFLTISPENGLILENQEIKYRNGMLESEKDEVILLRKELEPLLVLKHTLIKEGLLKEPVIL